MCGIVGYVGPRAGGEVVLRGLGELEYRGYDSAGIALHPGPGAPVRIVRALGASAELASELAREGVDPGAPVAIGHTRWATHGVPSVRNAHPHLSHGGRLALVHNGIIENYGALRRRLEPHGVAWRSDTDTEVLASWIERVWDDMPGAGLFEAAKRALGGVVGAYAVLILDTATGTIVAARRSSPLALGLGDGEVVLASDAIPIVRYTRSVVYLDDGDVAQVTRCPDTGKVGVEFFNLETGGRTPVPAQVDLEAGGVDRGGHDSFMLKEIHEQPSTVLDCMRGRLPGGPGPVVLGGLEPILPRFLRAQRINIVACGTSWHAALIGKHLIETLARVPVEVDYASEFRYRDPILSPGDVVVAISQSGETADTRAALELAKERGAVTFGIVNVVGSSIARLAHGGIYTRSGVEVGVASTKAFTGQVTALALLALRMAWQLRSLDEEACERLGAELLAIPEKVGEVLASVDRIREVADAYSGPEHRDFLFLGRGISFPVALEGALKLKEISYAHAEAYPAGEMKHGPIALVDPHCPTVCVAPADRHYEKVVSNMQEIRARSGPVIAIVTAGNGDAGSVADRVIEVPATHELLTPLLTVIPLQVLAHRIAVNRGRNVDKPRNLAKSVTVE